MSHKKFGPDRFSRFDVYWIQTDKQTNKQTDRQAKFIHRFDIGFSPLQKYDTERGRKEDKKEESGKC